MPKFRRGFIWSSSPQNNISPAALYTETAPPLPSPPAHLLNNPAMQASLRAMKDHVKVETSFNVDRFENLLADHPNQPFVRSVMTGLREGFWPFHDGEYKAELEMKGENFATDPADLEAIRAYRDKEVGAAHWSGPLPQNELLSGMKTSPMFVVWQKEKPRVITDHKSSGLNDGIPRAEAHVRYDDMHDFGQALHEARVAHPNRKIMLFKSDVQGAFLNLPAHPLWQLHQVVEVDGVLHIVRRLVFGNRASPRCWCAVSGLLCWIAVRKLDLTCLYVYMDDFFGWDFVDNLIFYHGQRRPRRQVLLLIMWEFIGCPFEDRKQEHAVTLKIIGFWVDATFGSISLSPESVADIIAKVEAFITVEGRQHPLREWQKLGGYLNWMLNVLPWARPALTELYRKMKGKLHANANIFLNREVIQDLTWLSTVIRDAIGVRFVDAMTWRDDEADMIIWTDASLRTGLSFIYSNYGFAYQLRECPLSIKIDIFFLELVAILSAVHHAASLPHPPRRLLIWSDSLDSVSVLASLAASESIHNGVILAIAQIILTSGIDLRVNHIAGKKNIRADLLSRFLFEDFRREFPSVRVRLFTPPRELLPARWRECF
ncbi:hypothetical protein GGX14DRAFT_381437 [Mycena pura]|uniref:Reverse transcriptase domain-containing protein n=1 Tax=Mycena pura TaxID=153505 RepID=A0AAD6UN25_9AGAR|nr:hypothetical protein GGX14DRAFT_381437 [Mycena pura]